jgi:hypothetical protein
MYIFLIKLRVFTVRKIRAFSKYNISENSICILDVLCSDLSRDLDYPEVSGTSYFQPTENHGMAPRLHLDRFLEYFFHFSSG